jgi:hypothetical protein
MRKILRLPDAYRFPGFYPETVVRGIFGDPKARIVSLRRRRKKRPVAPAANPFEASATAKRAASATFLAATHVSISTSRFAACTVAGALP